MVKKKLGKMEVSKGFIQIPVKSRNELIGDLLTPFKTFVNGEPARLDNYGRLWSPSLKDKFPEGGWIRMAKTKDGYQVELIGMRESTALGVEENINKEADITSRAFSLDHIKTVDDKLFLKAKSIYIYNDDISETNVIEKNSIDLIVTSPPYNVDIKYGNYDDKIPYDEYLVFTRKWLAKCYGFVKDDGRLCLNIPLDKFKGGHQSVYADITTIAKQVGWKYHSTIIWNEQNISRRTAWGSWLSASAPFVIAPVEVIVVLYKKTWKKTSGSRKSDIDREDFMAWTNGVWNFSGESRNKIGHPAPFPVELPRRCIKLFSFVGDTVLDPFLGSGTTLIACVETNREGIGVEINREYCELAKKRLEKHGELFQQKLM